MDASIVNGKRMRPEGDESTATFDVADLLKQLEEAKAQAEANAKAVEDLKAAQRVEKIEDRDYDNSEFDVHQVNEALTNAFSNKSVLAVNITKCKAFTDLVVKRLEIARYVIAEICGCKEPVTNVELLRLAFKGGDQAALSYQIVCSALFRKNAEGVIPTIAEVFGKDAIGQKTSKEFKTYATGAYGKQLDFKKYNATMPNEDQLPLITKVESKKMLKHVLVEIATDMDKAAEAGKAT